MIEVHFSSFLRTAKKTDQIKQYQSRVLSGGTKDQLQTILLWFYYAKIQLSAEGSNAGKVEGKTSNRVGLSYGGNEGTAGGPSWGMEPPGENLYLCGCYELTLT